MKINMRKHHLKFLGILYPKSTYQDQTVNNAYSKAQSGTRKITTQIMCVKQICKPAQLLHLGVFIYSMHSMRRRTSSNFKEYHFYFQGVEIKITTAYTYLGVQFSRPKLPGYESGYRSTRFLKDGISHTCTIIDNFISYVP
jgi:hypothetical protein